MSLQTLEENNKVYLSVSEASLIGNKSAFGIPPAIEINVGGPAATIAAEITEHLAWFYTENCQTKHSITVLRQDQVKIIRQKLYEP
jgi:hypothetical protein